MNTLERKLKNYKVAEDYYDIQKEADSIKTELDNIHNNIVIYQNNIKSIKKGLNREINTTLDDVTNIYNEAQIYFSENLAKTLEETQKFYKDLLKNRKKKLLEHKEKLEYQIDKELEKAESMENLLNEKIKYLGDHKALDTFVAVNDKLAALKIQHESLDNYASLQKMLDKELLNLESNRIAVIEEATEYLESINKEIAELTLYFRELAKHFYPDATSGLSIDINAGKNKTLYNIEAKIESDSSDGINNVKIFCYDIMLLVKGYNHNVNFIFHDSRLYDGVDERQKKDMFEIIKEQFIDEVIDKQYIATLNQNQLEEIRKHLPIEDYIKIFEDNIVLTLTDEDDTKKLLGIKVDI